MEKSSQNIQDSFLNNARKEKSLVTVYLVGGVRLNGRIKSFDKYSLIMETGNQEHLVFKHAISTVLCARSQAHGAVAGSSHSIATAPRAENVSEPTAEGSGG